MICLLRCSSFPDLTRHLAGNLVHGEPDRILFRAFVLSLEGDTGHLRSVAHFIQLVSDSHEEHLDVGLGEAAQVGRVGMCFQKVTGSKKSYSSSVWQQPSNHQGGKRQEARLRSGRENSCLAFAC